MAEFISITVWQPWATLIAIGAKPYEFRRYKAPLHYIGKRIAIHAGARHMEKAEVGELLDRLDRGDKTTGLKPELTLELLRPVYDALGKAGPSPLPLSAVVCLATLGKNVRGLGLAEQLGITNDSDRMEHSNWGWPLTDIEAIPGPHPHVRGRQGWWYWQDHRL